MFRLFAWCLNVLYGLVLTAALPLLLGAHLRYGKYREGYAQKFLGRVPGRPGEKPCFWLHAVSVGEVNLLGTTIGQLRQQRPGWDLVVSTTTQTGFDLARRKYPGVTVFYCPLDFSWAVATALGRIRPTVLVLAELELWPNLILAAKARGTRVAIINGRLSDGSFRGYRCLRPFIGILLRQLDLVAAQNEEAAGRFLALGAPRQSVRVTGSLKYDGAETDRHNPRTRELRELAGLSGDDIVFLAGSTQEPEEKMALNIFRQLSPAHPRLRLVLVPRHPERFDEVAQLLERSGQAWTRRSRLTPARSSRGTSRVLLVDTVGELAAWWGTAHIALVGGSFGNRGGQNMIEPAAYGVAVAFGPHTRNFREISAALLAARAAEMTANGIQLEGFVRRCLEEPAYASELGRRARALVASQLGATDRTVELLLQLEVEPASPNVARAA